MATTWATYPRSCYALSSDDTNITRVSLQETGTSAFGSFGSIQYDCRPAEKLKLIYTYTSRSEGVFAGLVVYMMLFGMFTVAGIYLGIRNRRPIYAPVVFASFFYVLTNAPHVFRGISMHYVGDVLIFIFLLSLNVQWHEVMTRPKSKRSTRMGWLIAGIVFLLLSVLLFLFTIIPATAGSAVYCAVSIVGFAFMVKGLLKAPDWRLPIVIDRKDQWEHFHHLGWIVLCLWTLMFFKKVYFIVFGLVDSAGWNVIFFCVPELIAAATVFIGIWPGSVTDVHTLNYTFTQQDMETQAQDTLDVPTADTPAPPAWLEPSSHVSEGQAPAEQSGSAEPDYAAIHYTEATTEHGHVEPV